MTDKEYIILAKNAEFAKELTAELEDSSGNASIPSRPLVKARQRISANRTLHYFLSSKEAEQIANDSRVASIELSPREDNNIKLELKETQTGNFNKSTNSSGDFVNWGLLRCNKNFNPYIGAELGGYDYTLDGTGIDIVIQDTGIQPDHPEFLDYDGNSRVQQIDWYAETGVTGTMPLGHYTDYHGHGTHCAGISAGKTYGWAKNAHIYAIKVDGLEGPTDPNPGIPVEDAFDLIKVWHANKPIDPATGLKRPTIVNMSWGYGINWDGIGALNYRGQTFTGNDIDTVGELISFGLIPIFRNGRFITNYRINSVDTDVQELIDAGVHVTIAAGNRSHKIDLPTGPDYNNFIDANTGDIFYNRGSSPYSLDALSVGNIDSQLSTQGLEQKSVSSETGPGVSIYAPGTNIFSAASTVNIFTDGDYPSNSNFKIANISGTSMAAPQIAGILSLYLQINPDASVSDAKAFLTSQALTDSILDDEDPTAYSNFRSLLGGANLFAFNRFNSANRFIFGDRPLPVSIEDLPTYSLTASDSTINEGENVVISLTTTNLENGETVPYTISGVSEDDISVPLTGSFIVNDNSSTLNIVTTQDLTTEGPETLSLSIDGVSASIDIDIVDTSTTPIVQGFELSANNSTVDEGDTVIITLTTEGLNDNTLIPYTITGVSADDISTPLVGEFNVVSNSATLEFTVLEDETTEGTETLIVSLDNQAQAVAVIINDTSTSFIPSAPTYTLSSNVTEISEGGTLIITLQTTNVPDSTEVPYQVSGINAADLASGSLSGNFVISEDTAELTFVLSEDSATEGTETLILSLTGETESISIDVLDTSQGNNPTYNLSTTAASVNEGQTFTVTLNTTNVPDAGTVAYTISGVSVNDISLDNLEGAFTISSNQGTLEIQVIEDNLTEGAETLILSLDNGADSISVDITDTSTTQIPTYQVSPQSNNVDEGSPLTINVSTTNVDDATTLYWTVNSPGDFETASGNFTITSDAGSFTVTPTADETLEGAETFTVSIRTGSTAGSVVATSSNITINDTSKPTFALSTTSTAISEGDTVTVTLTTTLLANGSTVGYTVSGIDESDLSQGNTAGDFVISNNTANIQFTLAEDQTTEGLENMTVSLANGQDSITISVEDTSLDPSADYILNVGNSGASHYLFNGNDRSNSFNNTQDPTLNFNVGDIVDFVVAAPGHPFYLKTVNSTGTGNQADGVVNNGAQNDTVRWIIPVGYAGQTLHYNCEFHGSMHGTINIT